jgi:hypothetical protein
MGRCVEKANRVCQPRWRRAGGAARARQRFATHASRRAPPARAARAGRTGSNGERDGGRPRDAQCRDGPGCWPGALLRHMSLAGCARRQLRRRHRACRHAAGAGGQHRGTRARGCCTLRPARTPPPSEKKAREAATASRRAALQLPHRSTGVSAGQAPRRAAPRKRTHARTDSAGKKGKRCRRRSAASAPLTAHGTRLPAALCRPRFEADARRGFL